MDNKNTSDEYFMQIALKEAQKAYNKDEVPIGALIVSDDGKIISKAHNSSEHGKNALEHAEIKAMYKASKVLKQTRLWDCSLYVTIEPCTMCATAISMMRIKKVVYGASNPKGGGVESGVKFFNQPSCFHKPNIKSKVLEEETSRLLKEFFKNKRKS